MKKILAMVLALCMALSLTAAFADGYKTIDAAKVNVSGNGESHDFVWNGSRWECAFLPRFNVVYKLSIETGDGHELSSVMTFPPDCRLRRYRLIEHRSLNYFGNTFAGYYYIVFIIHLILRSSTFIKS